MPRSFINPRPVCQTGKQNPALIRRSANCIISGPSLASEAKHKDRGECRLCCLFASSGSRCDSGPGSLTRQLRFCLQNTQLQRHNNRCLSTFGARVCSSFSSRESWSHSDCFGLEGKIAYMYLYINKEIRQSFFHLLHRCTRHHKNNPEPDLVETLLPHIHIVVPKTTQPPLRACGKQYKRGSVSLPFQRAEQNNEQ